MGTTHAELTTALRRFITRQRLFFVGTAPAGDDGHVNLSPKGLELLQVLGPREIAYLDLVGSGAETIAHVRDNRRITLMFCAFDGPPNIVRVYGRGEVIEPQDARFPELRQGFAAISGVRAVIRVDIERVADSCGFGVPLFEYRGQRSQLTAWASRKGEAGLRDYQRQKNAVSLDGLPALRWVVGERLRSEPEGERLLPEPEEAG